MDGEPQIVSYRRLFEAKVRPRPDPRKDSIHAHRLDDLGLHPALSGLAVLLTANVLTSYGIPPRRCIS